MNDETRMYRFTYTAQAVSWTFWALATILFALKTFSRFAFDFKPHLREDLVLSISWIFAVLRQSFYQQGLTSVRAIDPSQLDETVPAGAFWMFFADYWFCLSSPLPKLAIGLVIIRVFEPRRSVKYAIWGLCVLLGVLGIIGFFISMFYCNPAEAQWNPYQHPDAHCWSEDVDTTYIVAFAIIGGLVDFAFAIYPCVVIWKLKIPTWKKLCTALLMGLGVVSGALSLIKLAWLFPLYGNESIYRKLYDGTILGLFCAMENDIVICAACLPFAAATFRACMPHLHTYSGWFNAKMRQVSSTSQGATTDEPKTESESDSTQQEPVAS